MPLQQLIAWDLYENRSKGIGRMPTENSGYWHESQTLNDFLRVKESTCAVSFSYGDRPNNRLNVDLAVVNHVTVPDYKSASGFYLGFQDGWSTVATLTRTHPTVFADNFSGCLYSVYNGGHGVYRCVPHSPPE